MRLDALCADLLRDFFRWLQAPEGGDLPGDRAAPLAHAADRYLRDFAVDIAEAGPADADPSLPRRYLANWYIVHTLTPSHPEIDRIRQALVLLHRYLAETGIADTETALAAQEQLGDAGFFHERLEAFWGLTPEGISAWRSVEDYPRARRSAPCP